MNNHFDNYTKQVDAVEYARIAGRTIYDSYSQSMASASGRSFRQDGVIVDHKYNIEITPLGDIFGRHKDVKDFLKDSEFTGKRVAGIANFESHHLIPAEILIQSGIDEDDGIAVAVDWQGHIKDIHGYGGLQQNLLFADVTEMKNYYKSEYNEMGAGEWGKKLEDFIEGRRELFEKGFADAAERVESHSEGLSRSFFPPTNAIDPENKGIDDLSDSIDSQYTRDRIK